MKLSRALLTSCLGLLASLVREAEAKAVQIVVNASYSADSAWSEADIRQRFGKIDTLFGSACSGLTVVLGEVVPIREPELQDVDGSLGPVGVVQMKKILAKFQVQRRPTIIYARNGQGPGHTVMTALIGQSYMLGGPRPIERLQRTEWNDLEMKTNFLPEIPFGYGVLDWDRLSELRQLHGVIIIGQSSSYNYVPTPAPQEYQVDAHELGHILTNDPSHRLTKNNLMSGETYRHIIDADQCELMKAFPASEKIRDLAVHDGMSKVCNFAFDLINQHPSATVKPPQYCIEEKNSNR